MSRLPNNGVGVETAAGAAGVPPAARRGGATSTANAEMMK